MEKRLMVNSSPHFHSSTTTSEIMTDVVIALLPTLLAAAYIFGYRVITVTVICIAASVIFEFLYRRILKLPDTIGDMSAVVTGILLAYNLPVTIPLWMAIIGCFVAVVIVKQLFGGIGKNFANPAIVGRIVLFVSFATPMTNWVLPKALQTADAATGATPLAQYWSSINPATPVASEVLPGYRDLFLGMVGGSMGETCKLTLIIGFLYLVIRRVVSPSAPVAFIGTVFLATWALGHDPVYQILSGGLMLGAFFMATDYVTTPVTERGKLIFGIGCGLITTIIRLYASYPEGVSFAILLMNILSPHIDNLCRTKALGGAKA